jgi:hypothetical protein
MSQLSQEFWTCVEDYVTGRIPLSTRHEWLAAHVQAVADSRDAAIEDADEMLWTLISEMDYGHRSEEEIKALLRSLLEERGAAVSSPQGGFTFHRPAGGFR